MLFVYLTVMSEKNYLLRKTISVACFLLLLQGANAQNSDVVLKTLYENGVFETEAHIETTASREIMYNIIADIASHARRLEIDSLEWALKGLSGDEEGKNLIRVNYEGGVYEPTTEIIDFFIGIAMRKNNFKNIKVSVLMDTDNKTFINAELYSSNFFLKSARGALSVRQSGARLQFVIISSVRFGWFFNLFISTSNYGAVAEWRIQTVLENLKAEAGKR